jgi:hypothetical protein
MLYPHKHYHCIRYTFFLSLKYGLSIRLIWLLFLLTDTTATMFKYLQKLIITFHGAFLISLCVNYFVAGEING